MHFYFSPYFILLTDQILIRKFGIYWIHPNLFDDVIIIQNVIWMKYQFTLFCFDDSSNFKMKFFNNWIHLFLIIHIFLLFCHYLHSPYFILETLFFPSFYVNSPVFICNICIHPILFWSEKIQAPLTCSST